MAMDEPLKRRLVGAAVWVSLAVIFVPMFFDPPPNEFRVVTDIPERPPELQVPTPVAATLRVPETPLIKRRMAADEAALSEQEPVVPSTPPRVRPTQPTIVAQTPVSAPETPTTADKEDTPSTNGAWVVQLGSFANGANATALRDRLRDKGHAAFIVTASGEKGSVSRTQAKTRGGEGCRCPIGI